MSPVTRQVFEPATFKLAAQYSTVQLHSPYVPSNVRLLGEVTGLVMWREVDHVWGLPAVCWVKGSGDRGV